MLILTIYDNIKCLTLLILTIICSVQKCNETKIKEDEEKKFLFFESMRRDIMGRTRRSRPKTY